MMSEHLMLVSPSEEYIDEIRSYRQEFFDDGGHFNGDSGLRKFEDINAWIEQCRLMENKETVPNPDWVEADQYMLVYYNQYDEDGRLLPNHGKFEFLTTMRNNFCCLLYK